MSKSIDDFYGDGSAPKKRQEENETPCRIPNEKEIVKEYELPKDVDPVEMTEEIVDQTISQLESDGLEEGIDFLIWDEGKILCTNRVDRAGLLSKGLKVGDLK